MIELGRRLGRTVDELGRSMSAAEFTRQRAFDQVVFEERRRAEEKATKESKR